MFPKELLELASQTGNVIEIALGDKGLLILHSNKQWEWIEDISKRTVVKQN